MQGSANAGYVAVVVAARVCVTAAAIGVLRHHVADVVPDEGVSVGWGELFELGVEQPDSASRLTPAAAARRIAVLSPCLGGLEKDSPLREGVELVDICIL